jgi:transcriptional regulator with XRE-family HTH domain
VFEIGATLREARERQGLELPQIERALKILARQLQALEEERFDWLPGDAYARSFLRTYADYLGLEWQLYLAEYDSRFRRHEEELPLTPPRRVPPRRRIRAARPLALAVTAAVAIVIGLAAWQLGGTKQVAGPTPDGANVARRKHPAVPARQRPVKPAAALNVAPTPRPKPRPKPKPARVNGEVVFTTKTGACWILVRRGSEQGPQLYVATLQPGRTISFRGKRLWLRIGAPSSLRAVVNGHLMRLPAGAPLNLLVTPKGARVL